MQKSSRSCSSPIFYCKAEDTCHIDVMSCLLTPIGIQQTVHGSMENVKKTTLERRRCKTESNVVRPLGIIHTAQWYRSSDQLNTDVVYEVLVVTGDVWGAGTDANVFINLCGENGATGEKQLSSSQNHTNKFERNQEDVFSIESPELGRLNKIQIRHDNKGGGSSWFLGHIEIKNTTSNKGFFFPCQRWLSTKKDDGQIYRELLLSMEDTARNGGPAIDTQVSISDYAPTDQGDLPKVADLVCFCINEVELRGLHEKGIYRVPGSDVSVRILNNDLLCGRGSQTLMSNVDDIHVVCGCLKEFLRRLKEPLITFQLWSTFQHAACLSDDGEAERAVYELVKQLPEVNRDTLAAILLHLHRVSTSEACMMGVKNLCTVFGPSLISYSIPDPEPLQMLTETGVQVKIMARLLSIPPEKWRIFTGVNLGRIT